MEREQRGIRQAGLEVDQVGQRTKQTEQVKQAEIDEIEAIITPYCGRIIKAEERKELIEKLNTLHPKEKQVTSKINNIEQYGYTCKLRTDHKTYIIQKISENHTDI